MIFIFILSAIIIILWFYRNTVPEIDHRKKVSLILLRILAVISILILLFNPIYYFTKKLIKTPQIIILNDISDSMKNKSALFQPLKEQIIPKLKNYKIINFDFADGISKRTSSTNISKAFAEFSNKLKYVKSIIIFSDGWFKDEKLIFNKNIPIYSFAPEINVKTFEPQIVGIHHNNKVFQDEIATIAVDVSANDYVGKAHLNIYFQNKEKASETIDFTLDDFQQIIFEHTFESDGLKQFYVEIQPISKEVSDKKSSAIRVEKNRTEILLISDILNWDAKYIASTIRSNPRWSFELLIKDRQYKKGREAVNFEAKLKDVSVLIFINNGNLKIGKNEKQIVERFIGNGGGLFIMGKPIQNLKNILPIRQGVVFSEFPGTIHFTEQSKQFQSFNFAETDIENNIPPVNYYFVEPEIQSIVLAKFNNDEHSAAMIFDNYEKGKIIYFPLLNLWKWQLRENNNQYFKLISNMMYWLSTDNSERFFAETNKNSYNKGETVQIELSAFDEKLFPITNLSPKIINKPIIHKAPISPTLYAMLGKIKSLLGDIRCEVKSPIDGRILGFSLHPQVIPGRALYHICYDKENFL
jgi:hypothetical protein